MRCAGKCGNVSVRVVNPNNTMCKNMFRSVRRLAGVAGIVAVCVLLAGCAVLGNRAELGAIDRDHLSLKDRVTPAIAMHPAPSVTKVSNLAPARPASAPQTPARAGVHGVSADCGSSDGCLSRLKALLDDTSRKWVGQPQPPAELANGTRQFAYRALRTKLTCNELALAINEIVAATRTFQTPVPGVALDQVARIRTLNAQVETELRAERAIRCST
jgi:hypothetical protein